MKYKPYDYSKKENWLINDCDVKGKDYDLLFICGTSIIKQTQPNGIADNPDEFRRIGLVEYKNLGETLSEGARVFCPIQRQVSLSHLLTTYQNHDNLINDVKLNEPFVDLCAFLDYYFEHYNKDAKRPFVLAGHSQGGASVILLLIEYFLKTEKIKYLKNMVAAYSLGYGVSKKMWDAIENKDGYIHFTTGENDFNCLISWNVEGNGPKDKNFLLPDDNYDTYVINPLNWKVDETYAGINQNLGVVVNKGDPFKGEMLLCESKNKKDLFDAQIDLKRGSVICTTCKDFAANPISKKYIWGGKSLHTYEGIGYYNNIKANLKVRLNNFLAYKTK